MNHPRTTRPKRTASTYDPSFGVLSDLWEQTKLFPSTLQHDEFVHELIADLQSALAAMLIVLRTREEKDFSGLER